MDGVWISVLYKPILPLDGLRGHWGIGVIGSCFLVHLLLIKTVLKSQFFIRTVKILYIGPKPILALTIIQNETK